MTLNRKLKRIRNLIQNVKDEYAEEICKSTDAEIDIHVAHQSIEDARQSLMASKQKAEDSGTLYKLDGEDDEQD